MVASLLPPNGTPLLRAFEQAAAYEPHVEAGLGLIPNVKGRNLPAFLQFLLWEYGLIELVPYLDNPYVLMTEGRPWQIERDTFAAVARGLGWVGAPGTIVEAPGRRTWWNNFQLYLGALPANDAPMLQRIDRVTRLGKPFRSDFRRGVWNFDAPALEAGWTRLGASMLADDSGVRIEAGGPKWSFRRHAVLSHLMTEAEGTALGNWVPPPEGEIPWSEMDFPWATADVPWASDSATVRRALMAAWFVGRRAHVRLKDGDGEVIGYRRAGVHRVVKPTVGGLYSIAGLAYSPAADGTAVLIGCTTDAGNGAGQTAAGAEVVIDGDLAEGIPVGRLWLEPDQLSGGITIAPLASTIPLRATVRERLFFLVRF